MVRHCAPTLACGLLFAGSGCTHDFDGLRVDAASSTSSGSGASGSGGEGAQGSGAASSSATTGGMGGGGGVGTAGAGGVGGGACAIRSVIDDFKDSVIDPALWTVQGSTIEETGGLLKITPPGDTPNADIRLASAQTFDLHGCSIDVEVVEVLPAETNGPTAFKAVADGFMNWLRIGVVGEMISFSRKIDGNNDYLSEIAYEPGPHRHWRIAEAAGIVEFSTSSDGKAWVKQYEAPTPEFASAVKIQLSAGTYMAVSMPGTAEFDNVNKGQ